MGRIENTLTARLDDQTPVKSPSSTENYELAPKNNNLTVVEKNQIFRMTVRPRDASKLNAPDDAITGTPSLNIENRIYSDTTLDQVFGRNYEKCTSKTGYRNALLLGFPSQARTTMSSLPK